MSGEFLCRICGGDCGSRWVDGGGFSVPHRGRLVYSPFPGHLDAGSLPGGMDRDEYVLCSGCAADRRTVLYWPMYGFHADEAQVVAGRYDEAFRPDDIAPADRCWS